MSFTGGALALCKVCVKANEICAFAIIFQFITLHLEQIKPKRLQSVTNFQRGGGGGTTGRRVSLSTLLRAALMGLSGEGGQNDRYPLVLPAGTQGWRIGPLLPNSVPPFSGKN